ncbi:MAG: PKD domain-containing protein, partial [Bacteroidota bacterium]
MRLFLLVPLICGYTLFLHAQNTSSISGVPNSYTSVSAINYNDNSITVTNTQGFQPGDKVLLIQMQGGQAITTNNASFGAITDVGATGLYEIQTIASISNNQITLSQSLINTYDDDGVIQLVQIPVFENATTQDTVRAQVWDGNTGGVLIFEVSETLTIEHPIYASESGFRGGAALVVASDCTPGFFGIGATNADSYSYDAGNWRGAYKGEGIIPITNDLAFGRGPWGNGGGGGNDHNTGGGGGSNNVIAGNGGQNNRANNNQCRGENPGLGGSGLDIPAERIIMGGGGGAGHSNNTTASVGGGNGGGIVIIIAKNIIQTNGGIFANGGSPGIASGDGAGGGGAGGTIILSAETIGNNVLAEAKGGDGGSVDNFNQDRCFGPGGGGGGGMVYTSVNNDNPVQSFIYLGGQAGLSFNSVSCGASTNGAQEGFNGQFFIGYELAVPQAGSLPMANFEFSTSPACSPVSVQFTNLSSEDATELEWFFPGGTPEFSRDTNPVIDYTQSGMYEVTLVAENDSGTDTFRQSIELEVFQPPIADFVFDQNQLAVQFTNQSQFAEDYRWEFGDGNISISENIRYTYRARGRYEILLIAINECGRDTARAFIGLETLPISRFSVDTTKGCSPFSMQFINESSGVIDSYSWSFQDGNPSFSTDENPIITYDSSGTYEVVLVTTNIEGSNVKTESFTIEVLDPPLADFSYTTEDLTANFTDLSQNADQQAWFILSTDLMTTYVDTIIGPLNSYEFPEPGTYSVTMAVSNTCDTVISTQLIEVNTPPLAFF